MALVDTGDAIGRVTQLLVERLNNKTGLDISVGRPEPSTNGATCARLNLFLYEAQFDPSLKNVSLDEGQPAPLWLILKYLITAFDNDGNSDTVGAYVNLGLWIRSLQDLNFLSLMSTINPDILNALQDNPEPLKITFDEMPLDILSKLMQGSDEKYRFSLGFQIRPVMIATGEPPSYSLLVGVDYTASPPALIGEEGIQLPVIPSMGTMITEISPSKFEVNSTLTILGNDLNLSGLSVMLGSAELAVTAQQPNKLQCVVNGAIAGGTVISAGSHPISVVQTLPTGRKRSSNLLVGNLLPTLISANTNSLANNADSTVFGNIDMTGVLMGTLSDDVFLALYKDGETVKVFDAFDVTPSPPAPPLSPAQTQIRFEITSDKAVPPGVYRIILRINGQQAKNSPEVELVV